VSSHHPIQRISSAVSRSQQLYVVSRVHNCPKPGCPNTESFLPKTNVFGASRLHQCYPLSTLWSGSVADPFLSAALPSVHRAHLLVIGVSAHGMPLGLISRNICSSACFQEVVFLHFPTIFNQMFWLHPDRILFRDANCKNRLFLFVLFSLQVESGLLNLV
jgi:hypothetical protein